MSFDFASLNPEILDQIRPVFEKRSHDWTDDEATQVALVIHAMQVVLNQRSLPPQREMTEPEHKAHGQAIRKFFT